MIVFDKDLASNKHLWVFNNNIIEFHDDSEEEVLYAVLTSDDFTTDPIYPDSSGKFRFNFIEYLKAYAITNNLADTVQLDIDNTLASLVHNDTESTLYDLEVDITITRTGVDDISVTKNYIFITGVEQLDEYQRQERHQLPLFLLSRLNPKSAIDYHVNYWKGYPFDISIYSSTYGDLNIKNNTNLFDIDLPVAVDEKVNRIALSDAQSDVTIEDHLSLRIGLNKLQITRPGYDSQVHTEESPLNVDLIKHEGKCGHYIKFRNAAGGWSYWLFHRNSTKNRRVSRFDELKNDFNNIENTFAPEVQTGIKASNDRLKAYAVRISELDLWNLQYIIESPKIYLFTGERYSINSTNSDNQWIEIKCTNRLLDITEPQKKKFSFNLDFQLPQRNKVSLL